MAALALPAAAGASQATPASGGVGIPDKAVLDGDAFTDALTDATPEELERRRAEVSRRLAEAGSAEDFVKQLEAESAAKIAALDVQLAETQARLAEARLVEAAAVEEKRAAEAKSAEATKRAEAAEAELRSAAVDMFINPPQAETMIAALSGTVEEEMASTGLLVGRAHARREISVRTNRARALARQTSLDAARAAKRAEGARDDVQKKLGEVTSQLDQRSLELQSIQEELDALRSEIKDLELTDGVLRGRLLLNQLARSGSVTALRGPDGELVPNVSSLPQREDMVRILDTSIWVHELVAPSVTAMVLAARQDGVYLNGGAYRDSRRQIQLRAAHCGSSYDAIFNAPSSSCSPPTAPPGRSMHERGLAIDFNEGGRALTRGTRSFQWLSANAARFGFFNLPSEAWHWSINGH